MYLNYPTAREVLATLYVLLQDIQNDEHNCAEAELADIVDRLNRRIAELEREIEETEDRYPWAAWMTSAQIQTIRDCEADGCNEAPLEREFSVTRQTIYNIPTA